MSIEKQKMAFYTLLLGILFVCSTQVALGQGDQTNMTRPRRVSRATSVNTIPNGKEITLEGNVTKTDETSFSVCDRQGTETVVQYNNSTRITTHRRGIFRGAKTHNNSSLMVGLPVTVKGRGNEAGELVAKWIRFHDSSYKATTAVDTRAIPLEIAQDKMGDQLDETTIVATSALKDAKVAQDSADKAQTSADKAQNTADVAKDEANAAQRTAFGAHEKIAAIDDFDATEELTVTFKAGSAVLTKEAKTQLDEFAAKTASAKGYVIEISAFTSEEGGRQFNHRLSQERAEAVIDYLIDTGKVAPRRIIAPYSGGENNPIADNRTHEGRMQNRRAEIKLLVSKGLSAKEQVTASDK
jgi:outer membrane protein OmpA-like peptidoglycan-associated protein